MPEIKEEMKISILVRGSIIESGKYLIAEEGSIIIRFGVVCIDCDSVLKSIKFLSKNVYFVISLISYPLLF